MKLRFLGTAASEGYPNPFCTCANCGRARSLGGRSVRLRSALLVNDDLLLDLGPDLLASAQKLQVDLNRVTTALVTHGHEDHLDVTNIRFRKEQQMSARPPRLRIFGPPQVMEAVLLAVDHPEAVLVDLRAVEPFESWEHGGYGFAAYPATHGAGRLQCRLYSVSDGRQSFLYACDTGPLPDVTWRALSGETYDAIILDETLGLGERYGHMSLDQFADHHVRFRAEGMLKAGGRMIAQHFSHMWNPVHDELVRILEPQGVVVAYDGLEIDL